jgi:hypothetical protein
MSTTIEQEDERPVPTPAEVLERAQQESAAANQKLVDDYYLTHPRAEQERAPEEIVELRPGHRFHKLGAKSPSPQTHHDEPDASHKPTPTVRMGNLTVHGAGPGTASRGVVVPANPPAPPPPPDESQPERARTVFHGGFQVQGEKT